MPEYRLVLSRRFREDMAEIQDDALGFGPDQTQRHTDAILDRCAALAHMTPVGRLSRFAGESIVDLPMAAT